MKKTILTALMAIFAVTAFAQSEADMQKWMEYATPGDMHKMLGKYNGRWTAATRIWMAPGQPPMESTADVVTDMYMGDRYQRSTYTGDMGGMPFSGESTTGYDNTRKVFTNTWIDNMSTGIMYSEGAWNGSKQSVEFKGTATDPMVGKIMPFRQVITFTNADSYKMEMYNIMEGNEYKSMEITYTRKK